MFKQSAKHQLILASGSPRRKELLEGLGLQFKIIPADCDESILPGENPKEMVTRLALLKAEFIARKFPDAYVIGADTTVVLDGEILGKPSDKDDAKRMLAKISGRWHEVWGGVAVVHIASGAKKVESHMSQVEMAHLSKEMIDKYVAHGEPMDKAGSYAIQGIGAALVNQVKGSYTNVVGLNMSALVNELRAFDLISS